MKKAVLALAVACVVMTAGCAFVPGDITQEATGMPSPEITATAQVTEEPTVSVTPEAPTPSPEITPEPTPTVSEAMAYLLEGEKLFIDKDNVKYNLSGSFLWTGEVEKEVKIEGYLAISDLGDRVQYYLEKTDNGKTTLSDVYSDDGISYVTLKQEDTLRYRDNRPLHFLDGFLAKEKFYPQRLDGEHDATMSVLDNTHIISINYTVDTDVFDKLVLDMINAAGYDPGAVTWEISFYTLEYRFDCEPDGRQPADFHITAAFAAAVQADGSSFTVGYNLNHHVQNASSEDFHRPENVVRDFPLIDG